MTLTRATGELLVTSVDGKWALRALYTRTPTGASLALQASPETEIRGSSGLLAKNGDTANVALGPEPTKITLVHGGGDELPLLLLYRPNGS
jgi:hypothetical protein